MPARTLLPHVLLLVAAGSVAAAPSTSGDPIVPQFDLSRDASRQVVVDREPGRYLGHPTTVLLEDGRTVIAVYPKGHGRGPIVMKRSEDGGRTWSDRLPVPENWATSKETPTIHRLVDPRDGTKRLVVFSGLHPIRRAYSEDDGATWTPLEPIGDFGGIVAMSSVVALADGTHAAYFHDDGRFFRPQETDGRATGTFRLFETRSKDGGLTWTEPRELWSGGEVHLCEPGVFRSPDGGTLAMFLRENRRRLNSHVMFSTDEGLSWSEPREVPDDLVGDRHAGVVLPDGRVAVSFRDTRPGSPTAGDWIAWIGPWSELVRERNARAESAFRVRLMDNHHRWDCAYPGVERLPDGTVVFTTYGHWTPDEPPYVVSVRLHPTEFEVAAPAPFGALPSSAQQAWHELEYYGFIHYGINAFTDREWGFGDESPTLFDPESMDVRQWAKVAKVAGMKGLVLTAKHHDGFCLWPTETTEHDIAASPWRDGEGDLVAEFVAACEAEGLRYGFYVSPWDRNHPEYGRPEYLEAFRGQWRELLERHPDAFELWFDGANGGDGHYGGARETRRIDRATYYRWDETMPWILAMAPEAIAFSDVGPGCRWVGNERGFSAETSWQTMDREGRHPGMSGAVDLAKGEPGGSHWIGVEADVSIRPGWFFHESENERVKSPEQLLEIWFASVGRGANLLLNLPPDRRGLVHERDIASLEGLRTRLDEIFSTDLILNRVVAATADETRGDSPRFGPTNLIDGDDATLWAADDDARTATIELRFDEPLAFDVVRLREPIEFGQRIAAFGIETWDGSAWRPLAEGTTIGPRRILEVPQTSTTRLRISIRESLASPLLRDVSLFDDPRRE
jgi:alpha-L-fucosidase